MPSALVTGASRGIGHGIAARLAADGWALTLTARGQRDLDRVRGELQEQGASIQVVAGDMAEERTAEQAVARHAERYGSMNALVLAAGVGSAGRIEGYPIRRFDKQFAVNVRAPFAVLGRALPLLRAGARADPERGGRVVAIASVEGVYPEEGLAAYGASKAALLSLVNSVNLEENSNGVTASAISPGYVDTDMSAWKTDTIPPESMIRVDDIVKVTRLLLSLSPNAVVPHLVVNRTGAGAHHA